MNTTETFLLRADHKVELAEVTLEMTQDATAWLRAWDGDFEFLASVKAQMGNKGRLSPAQAKGVLNCWRAELLRAAKAEHVMASDRTKPADVVPGIYVKDDGSIWKVQNSKADRRYAKVWVGINGERLTLAGTHEHGEWEYAPGAIFHLADAKHMDLEQAKQFILIYGRCVRCGRTLKAAESVERGIGPVCINYFSEWGA